MTQDNMWTRQQYMNKEVDHDTYYGQFSNEWVVQQVAKYIGHDRLMRSTDPYLNDIDLKKWDDGPWFGMDRMVGEANGTGGVTLSDKVCALKVAARKYIKQNQTEDDEC